MTEKEEAGKTQAQNMMFFRKELVENTNNGYSTFGGSYIKLHGQAQARMEVIHRNSIGNQVI